MSISAHPWSRYVALGDSFTDGIGGPEPASPGGNRGWADRVAEQLSSGTDDFAYANLAVRGKLITLREHLMPWVRRRIRHRPSGDHVLPKRPDAGPYDSENRPV